jgi:hypothetical protein
MRNLLRLILEGNELQLLIRAVLALVLFWWAKAGNTVDVELLGLMAAVFEGAIILARKAIGLSGPKDGF